MKNRYVFGPVKSRRLGRSLGIDLIPFKTCTYNCIYCELGKTTILTDTLKNSCQIEDVLKEIESKLNTNPDYITIAGSGEPTLFRGLKLLIKEIKLITDIPVAVITNGSLLWQNQIINSLLQADLIMPSLDACDEETFLKINRPFSKITFSKLIAGLKKLRKVYKGTYWLEIFLLKGINDSIEQIKQIASIAKEISADKTLLNSVKRPPAETKALTVETDIMRSFLKFFDSKTEVITDPSYEVEVSDKIPDINDILNLLKRRGCTFGEIQKGLKINPEILEEKLKYLQKTKIIFLKTINEIDYYMLTK